MSTNDVFTIDVPWLNTLAESPVQINEFEVPIIKLMQHIIDSLLEKLASKTGAADQELQQRYADVVKSRQDYIEKLERSKQATETMRGFRNHAEANEKTALADVTYWRDKFESLDVEHKKLKRQFKLAQDEIDGIPKLVENKVALELSRVSQDTASSAELQEAHDALDLSELQVSQLKEKNEKLVESNQSLNHRANEAEAKSAQLDQLAQIQAETIAHQQEAVANADRNYRQLMYHIDELQGYCSIITNENVQLSGDNLYLEQIRELHNMKQLWISDDKDWQAFFVAKSHLTDLPEGAPEPDRNFGIIFLINTSGGGGHTVYLDKEGSIVFPTQIGKECFLPEKYHESFKAGVRALPVEEMEAAIKRAVSRSRQIVKFATLIDPDWNATLGHVEIAQRMRDYIPEHELTRRLTSIERSRALAPNTMDLIARINKRFGSAYVLKNNKPKIGGAAKGQRKKKRAKRK
jgi:heme-degrading monooxygenase HmoA